MTDEESLNALIAEASDPTTLPTRLAAILPDVLKLDSVELVNALLGNPNLPVDLLRRALLSPPIHPFSVAAWHNPTTTMLLMMEPLPEYAAAACRVLRWTQGGRELPDSVRDNPGSLSSRVALLAREQPGASQAPTLLAATAPDEAPRWADEARSLARHMARLFRLPWPERALSSRRDHEQASG